MGNEIKKALEKKSKLEERYLKMVGIFEKSETKRAGTVAKLQAAIERCNKKAAEIAAKKDKILGDLQNQIAAAEKEETELKATLVEAAKAAEASTPQA